MTGILAGKSALVTGGASGIGRATALAMAREGARVAVADMTEASAAATVALITAAGGQAIAIAGDVAKEADVAAMVARSVAAFGRLDCAFNNAGIEVDFPEDQTCCGAPARGTQGPVSTTGR